MEIKLYPDIEFMGDLFPTNISLDQYNNLWFELTDQLLKRYSGEFEWTFD